MTALEGDFATSSRSESESSPELWVRAWRQALAEYSLVTVTSGDSFVVHGLVQAVERHQLESHTKTRWLTAAIDAFVNYAPRDTYEFENWQRWRPLVSHAEALRVHAQQARLIIDRALLKGLCEFHRRQGAWTAAVPLALQALAQDERVLGPADPATLWDLNAVALLRCYLGDYGEAESLCRRALVERERVIGSDHPDTLWSGTNLGFILARRGDYASAERLHRPVLSARERTLGPEHPDTLSSLNQLAGVLANQGDYENARALAHRGFLLRERVLGPDHPDTLTSMSTLGTVLFHPGDEGNAEGWLRRALDAQERAMGPEHPFTLMTVSVLAALVEQQGNRDAAQALFRRALSYETKLAVGRPVNAEPPIVPSLTPIPAVLTRWGPIASSGDREVAEALYSGTLARDERIPSPGAKHAPKDLA